MYTETHPEFNTQIWKMVSWPSTCTYVLLCCPFKCKLYKYQHCMKMLTYWTNTHAIWAYPALVLTIINSVRAFLELHTASSLSYSTIGFPGYLLNWPTFICIKYQFWLSSVEAIGASDATKQLRLCYLAWGINTGFFEELTWIRGLRHTT